MLEEIDLINLRPFHGASEQAGTTLVKVVAKEHIIQPESDSGVGQWKWQKVMIFTSRVEDLAETRVRGYPHAE